MAGSTWFRRVRTRFRTVYFLGLVAILIGAIGIMSRRGPSPADRLLHEGTGEILRAAAVGPVPEEILSCVDEFRVRPGQTAEGALVEAGMDPAGAFEVLRTLDSRVDLRRIRPEDRFLIFRSRSGDLRRLEYQRNPEQRVVVTPAGAAYRAEVETIPVHVVLRKLAGTVTDNLYLSLTASGGDPALVVEFADLFSWDFDFFTDTRNGDRFELLVEDRTVGGQPAGFGRIVAAGYLPAGADEPLEAIHYAWGDQAGQDGYYLPDGRSVKKFFLKSPLNYRRISSTFTTARMHPILKKLRPHLGVDYAAAAGTPVVALGNGKVVDASWHGGFGRTVKIKHNATYLTQYAHLSRYGKGIRAGTRVKQGQVIGYVGASGLATGPHLDFRVQANGRWINPLTLKGGAAEPLPARYRPGFDLAVARAHRLMEKLGPGESAPWGGDGEAPALASARLDTTPSS